ncbi:FAD-dependent oxidoreductase [Podospora didyma]|uniref:D-arabinono-1,4-lactone oxidase n=1 Tax=Podospora didyma TaxID=330526 RepID=A0AAE0TZL0_9PEZI|nr:FAD-dependent oxidoreductase [Podospora didyma]
MAAKQPNLVEEGTQTEFEPEPEPELSFSVAACATSSVWENCIGLQQCKPAEWRCPDGLQPLVETINDARAKGKRVRAVGSGHAFSDVPRTDDAFLIRPKNLTKVQGTDAKMNIPSGIESLKPDADPASLFRTQSGITIKDLNSQLESRKLALINMGAYDGQTIAGAFSTGTHGSGAAFGPLASFVESIVLATETGKVYQIEATNGITNPAKFPGHVPEAPGVPVELKQDDDWLNAVKVSMGCMGVIYSVTLRVQQQFSLEEWRELTTWEAVKPSFAPENFNPLPEPLATTDHYELLINPYVFPPNGPAIHTAIRVRRKRVERTKRSGARKSFFGVILEAIGVSLSWLAVKFLNAFPWLSPRVINTALNSLVEAKPPYVDNSYKVFQLGIDNRMKALALELHFDARDLVATIDALLAALGQSAGDSWYLPGPIGIRFVAPSDALLAPESGRLTATAELDMLFGTSSANDLLAAVKKNLVDKSTLTGDRALRIHWGLDPLDSVTADDAKKWYPGLEKWKEVRAALNTTGMFDNKFTDRIGVSKGE